MNYKDIRIADYNYLLPDERIAKFPVSPRDHSRLLVSNHGEISDDYFYNLPRYLLSGQLMVMNNTRVIQARLHFQKETGALIEIFLLEPLQPADYEQMFQATSQCSWHCLIGNLKKWKTGSLQRVLQVGDHSLVLTAEQVQKDSPLDHVVLLRWDDASVSFAEILEAAGELPIPPYLNRRTQQSDLTTYQTVYSRHKGSVAAPTAGLHFSQDVLCQLDEKGVQRAELTLHVGAGTFRPVKSETIGRHDMHTEFVSVPREVICQLLRHHCCAIAVGTTSVRTLESLYYMGCRLLLHPALMQEDHLIHHVEQWEPYTLHADAIPTEEALSALLQYLDAHQLQALHGSTQIIIVPGYRYRIVNALITNFHQPQSTLLLLVSAFLGGERWKEVYRHALQEGYRFLSYGDSSLLIP